MQMRHGERDADETWKNRKWVSDFALPISLLLNFHLYVLIFLIRCGGSELKLERCLISFVEDLWAEFGHFMGGVEDDEPPTKRVKASFEELRGLSDNRSCTGPATGSLGNSMARPLPSDGEEEMVGSRGFIKRMEFVRIITEALYSLVMRKVGPFWRRSLGYPCILLWWVCLGSKCSMAVGREVWSHCIKLVC